MNAGRTNQPAAPLRHAQGTGRRTLATLAAGALAWSLLMAASAVLTLYRDGWQEPAHIRAVAVLFGLSAFLAYPIAVILAGWISRGKRFDTRLAAHLFLIGAGTLGLTAAFYGLDHRAYFSQWHAAPFTVTWSIQYFFTVAGAFYQFAVFGMRLYLPIGIPALCLFALWHATKAR